MNYFSALVIGVSIIVVAIFGCAMGQEGWFRLLLREWRGSLRWQVRYSLP